MARPLKCEGQRQSRFQIVGQPGGLQSDAVASILGECQGSGIQRNAARPTSSKATTGIYAPRHNTRRKPNQNDRRRQPDHDHKNMGRQTDCQKQAKDQ